jgi:hypothetical protein
MVEWDVEVISSPFYIPKWDVRASEPVELPTEWKVFFRSAVNLTMPFEVHLVTSPSTDIRHTS